METTATACGGGSGGSGGESTIDCVADGLNDARESVGEGRGGDRSTPDAMLEDSLHVDVREAAGICIT